MVRSTGKIPSVKSQSLQEFVDAKQFKTYEELEARLNKVLGLDGATVKPRTTADDEDDQIALSRPTPQAEAPAPRQVAEPTTTTAAADDDLSFFERLANED